MQASLEGPCSKATSPQRRRHDLLLGNLQDRYAARGVCFGRGPKSRHGLKLKSVPSEDGVVAEWQPKPHHAAFGNFGSGGIIFVLMDCHWNWAVIFALMKSNHLRSPPRRVTSECTVRFLSPWPFVRTGRLNARPTTEDVDRASVSGELRVKGVVTATMTGLLVPVQKSQPAFCRWH